MKNYEGHLAHFVLSSGRKLHTYSRFIGLSVDDGGTPKAGTGVEQYHLGLVDANDQPIAEGESDSFYGGRDDLLTPEERREIADHMIAAWDKWAKGGGGT